MWTYAMKRNNAYLVEAHVVLEDFGHGQI